MEDKNLMIAKVLLSNRNNEYTRNKKLVHVREKHPLPIIKMATVHQKFFDYIMDVNGLREKTYPIQLYCLDNGVFITADLVCSNIVEQKNLNNDEKYVVYRLKLEGDYDRLTLVVRGVYNNKTGDFKCALKDEDDNEYIVLTI